MKATTTTKDEASVDRAAKLEKALSHAVDLVREFSERDPHDGDADNPWKDPQNMLDEFDRARQDIVTASQCEIKEEPKPVVDENDFRAAYMDLVTNAFGDVLEDMRNNNSDDELDVDILVDCLQSGMDFISEEEKEFLMMDDEEILPEEGVATPHEERQIQLGLNIH